MLLSIFYRRRTATPSASRLLAIACGTLLLPTARVAWSTAEPLGFDPAFIHQTDGQLAGTAALHGLASQTRLAPGRYRIDVSVNFDYLGPRDLELRNSEDGKGLQACMTAALLREAGLREEALPTPLPEADPCLNLAHWVPDASAQLDTASLSLALTLPQLLLRREVTGAIASDLWDAGIPAAFANYQVATQVRNLRNGRNETNHDLLVHSGLNVAGWRLRSSQSMRDDAHGGRQWSHTNTYAQHDLPDSHGTFTLGQTFSNGDIFRGLPFKGMQVASDPGMLPDIMQQYAPVISGVAQTRARLEVLQNGYPIYTTYVAPGPYLIDDLGVGASSGELEVVLTEADGSVRRSSVPYSTLNNLLRQGVWRYSATLGRYAGAEKLDNPLLWQATLARGGAWGTTVYGGVQGGDYYRAGTLGVARDWGQFGATAFDVTQANSDLGSTLGQVQGHSYAARYGKAFSSGTNLRFAGYRYSTEGYRDYDEAVRERNAYSAWLGNRRSRLEASAYQRLGQSSSLNLLLTQDDYWNTGLRRRQYEIQFNTLHRGVSYNLFVSQALNERSRNTRLFGLTLSMPLDFMGRSSASFDVQTSDGRHSQRASFSGSALDNRVNYTVSGSRDEQSRHSAALSGNYQGNVASYGAGITQSSGYQSLSLNATGSMLLHQDGLTFGPYLGDTNALVRVAQTPGVGVRNAPRANTDSNGFALVPNLRPYRRNQVILETDMLGPETVIDNGSLQVVPRRGAIVRADFAARKVARLVLTLLQAEGQPLPFGAQVSTQDGQQIAVVGQAGQALVAVDASPQTLHVRWGEQPQRHCELQIDPAQMPAEQGYRMKTLHCPDVNS
ncbi:fimbria/pilus outer membrane usher protein [Pseudomonas sp. NPDC089758]|uniref:fimbria/pilus outer membrane usher protein n=1 Tax=Pseudomonas sp. NPDC089758 TaxID=3364473 RepID=UPI0037F8BE0A